MSCDTFVIQLIPSLPLIRDECYTISRIERPRKDVVMMDFEKLFELSAVDVLFGIIGSSITVIVLYMLT